MPKGNCTDPLQVHVGEEKKGKDVRPPSKNLLENHSDILKSTDLLCTVCRRAFSARHDRQAQESTNNCAHTYAVCATSPS